MDRDPALRLRPRLAAFLRELGLAKSADALSKIALPTVRLSFRNAGSGSSHLGSSRFGGDPDLPEGTDWPVNYGRELDFLLQLDCAAIYHRCGPGVLPQTGRLWFFMDRESMFETKIGQRVLYSQVPASRLKRTVPKRRGKTEAPIATPEFPVRFDLRLSLPNLFYRRGHSRLAPDNEIELLEQFGWARADARSPLAGAEHRLLGYPSPEQCDDMEIDIERDSRGWVANWSSGQLQFRRRDNPKGPAVDERELKQSIRASSRWSLLLQLDSDVQLNWMWGSGGRLFFWIPRNALRERRFEETTVRLQTG